jgi:OmpA-OmpF porin, OOP family
MHTTTRRTGTVAAAVVLLFNAQAPWAEDGETHPRSTRFAQALSSDYRALSESESAQGDERDAASYARRSLDAAAGTPTAPETVGSRQGFLKEHHVPALTQARQRLMAAFDGAGRENAPEAAAHAQASFDCWLEQAAEDLQAADIEACRQSFLMTVAQVEAAQPVQEPVAVATPPTEPVPAQEPERHLLPFGFDNAEVSAEGMAELGVVREQAAANRERRIRVIGHASSVGDESYNLALSRRRAEAVKAQLLDLDVATDSIVTDARGENDPLVQAVDGVREPRNRAVEVIVER